MTTTKIEAPCSAYFEVGYQVFDLKGKEILLELGEELLERLKTYTKDGNITLGKYHEWVTDEERHTDCHFHLFETVPILDYAKRLFSENQDPLIEIAGKDIDLEKAPHLRIIRPNKDLDLLPLHRDTFYGLSPYATVAWTPITNCLPVNKLRVEPYSHIAPEERYPMRSGGNAYERGSKKHRLGYTYDPKEIDTEKCELHLETIQVPFGSSLFFNGAVVHGGVRNQAEFTRWSFDIKFTPHCYPGKENSNLRKDYYVPFQRSELYQNVEKYVSAART